MGRYFQGIIYDRCIYTIYISTKGIGTRRVVRSGQTVAEETSRTHTSPVFIRRSTLARLINLHVSIVYALPSLRDKIYYLPHSGVQK